MYTHAHCNLYVYLNVVVSMNGSVYIVKFQYFYDHSDLKFHVWLWVAKKRFIHNHSLQRWFITTGCNKYSYSVDIIRLVWHFISTRATLAAMAVHKRANLIKNLFWNTFVLTDPCHGSLGDFLDILFKGNLKIVFKNSFS